MDFLTPFLSLILGEDRAAALAPLIAALVKNRFNVFAAVGEMDPAALSSAIAVLLSIFTGSDPAAFGGLSSSSPGEPSASASEAPFTPQAPQSQPGPPEQSVQPEQSVPPEQPEAFAFSQTPYSSPPSPEADPFAAPPYYTDASVSPQPPPYRPVIRPTPRFSDFMGEDLAGRFHAYLARV